MLLSDVPVLAAHHAPEVIAVRFQEFEVSYVQLRDRCWRLSNALLKKARPGDRVAILAENCLEYVDCYYGVPGAGMALTLLNYRLSPRELAYIIGNSAPVLLITEAKHLPSIRQIRDQIPSVKEILLIGERAEDDCASYDDFVKAAPAVEPPVRPAETDLCWLLYTSGTTGLPKGAMLSHRNLMASIINSMTGWEAG